MIKLDKENTFFLGEGGVFPHSLEANKKQVPALILA